MSNGCAKMSDLLGWSAFGLKNNARESGNSYCTKTPEDVVALVLKNWSKAVPGQGETGLDRKILVPVDPEQFFCPPRANLVKGMEVKAEVKFRQDGEDPYLETFVEEAEATRHNALVRVPAKRVDIVCYSAEALLENGGTRSTDCDWEIVCLLASSGEKEPMLPLAMARNYLEMPGGTKGEYSAQEFAEAIYFHSSKKGVRVRLEPQQFICKTVGKKPVCPTCEGEGTIHDADFSQGDSDQQMFLKQDTTRPCPTCHGKSD